MAGDPGYGRYFAHMCLFTTSMLGLVLADNLFMMFIFWELVGLSSYLLIGFWFHKPSAAAAAKKAFIVTRVGDLGLLAAMLLIWYARPGTFDIAEIHDWAASGAASRPLGHHLVRARHLRRRGRQERAVPAARLAPGRDGRPDAGVRAHPCRDDGRGRRVPRGALLPGLRGVRRRPPGGRLDRRHHGAVGARRSRSCRPTSSACWPTQPSASSAT